MQEPSSLIVVNLFGGPGVGKSTLATKIFSNLRELGVKAEYVPESIKDYIWDGSVKKMCNQLKIFADFYYNIKRLEGEVDVAVLDSSLIAGDFYTDVGDSFRAVMFEKYREFTNLNYYLRRLDIPYETTGRIHSLAEAEVKDKEILDYLKKRLGRFKYVDFDRPREIIDDVLFEIREGKYK